MEIVYEIRAAAPNVKILWVSRGQNIFVSRNYDGKVRKEVYAEVIEFLCGRSRFKTIEELYWWANETLGYGGRK